MKLGLRQIIAILPVLLFPIIVTAQDLPKMPADPAIVTGSLPNGLSYYVISNAAEKGMADFALIQKTGTGNIPDSSAVESVRRSARETLTSEEFFATVFLRQTWGCSGKGWLCLGQR